MGSPVVHWELWSKDPAKISAFYERVFDWKVNYIPQMEYRLVETNAPEAMKGINGGIMQPKEGPWPGSMESPRYLIVTHFTRSAFCGECTTSMFDFIAQGMTC